MKEIKFQNLEDVRAELEKSPLHVKPKAGEPVLGYLGDLGHTYARPEELTKEALFGMGDAKPLVQSPAQKARAKEYEVQMATDNQLRATASGIQGLASRFINMLISDKEAPKIRNDMKP